MWFLFALGSAVFAALTSILAKIGIEGVNSTLATAIRTAVVLVMSWGMVFLTGTQGGMRAIAPRSWLFLILSGLATGASWLCYYHALQIGAASKVVPVDKLSVVITLAPRLPRRADAAGPSGLGGAVCAVGGGSARQTPPLLNIKPPRRSVPGRFAFYLLYKLTGPVRCGGPGRGYRGRGWR